MKWASIWRSIVLSCLGKTMFPYAQFIRVLELENLHELLRDPKFQHTAKIKNAFFAGDLAKYKVDRVVTQSNGRRTRVTIDIDLTLNNLAADIIPQVPMLQELRAPTLHFDITPFLNSVARFSHLNILSIFYGETLDGLGSLLNTHCPHFNVLEVYGWSHTRSDEICAKFLSDLRPNSMTTYSTRGGSGLNAQTFLALNHHRESLENLRLEGIHADAMPKLSKLSGCTNLKSLTLAENPPAIQDLEKRFNDTFLEMVAWLRECKNLRDLSFRNMLSGPGLLTPLLLEKDIKLIHLTLDGYVMSQSKEFHQALANQTSLLHLFLNGEGVEVGDPDNEALIESLCALENLRELQLRDVSDGFLNHHILRLTQSLPKLRRFGTTGYGVDDEIWTGLASLRSLQSLELNALSRFTVNGILEFIWQLGDGNRDLVLSINMQDNDCEIHDAEQAIVEEALAAKVDGRFGLTYWKGSYSFPSKQTQLFWYSLLF